MHVVVVVGALSNGGADDVAQEAEHSKEEEVTVSLTGACATKPPVLYNGPIGVCC